MMNVIELLNKGYEKCFEELELQKVMTLEGSNLNFRIYEGYGDATYKWELQFEKSVDFGRGNYKSFTFKSDLELGKFVFECKANNGLPKGAIGIIN